MCRGDAATTKILDNHIARFLLWLLGAVDRTLSVTHESDTLPGQGEAAKILFLQRGLVMACAAKLTQSIVKELFDYDPETGAITYRVPTRKFKTGDRAEFVDSYGYLKVSTMRSQYYAHRVIWIYMTGENPCLQIDHINNVKTDNRWCNLRLATPSQNKANCGKLKNNTSGTKGVSYTARIKRYRAHIEVNGKQIHLGCYKTIDEAKEAYNQAAVLYFGDYAQLNE
jgi:hypothetical protein